jgi:large subunit ribosomal protein L23
MNPTDARQVILRPVVTEKSLRMSERRNAYTFEVHPKANKVQIRTAVEAIFSVDVVDVRTAVRAGKPRRMGFRISQTPARKRAIVVVKQGQSLDVY